MEEKEREWYRGGTFIGIDCLELRHCGEKNLNGLQGLQLCRGAIMSNAFFSTT